jgi:hypothetical protein
MSGGGLVARSALLGTESSNGISERPLRADLRFAGTVVSNENRVPGAFLQAAAHTLPLRAEPRRTKPLLEPAIPRLMMNGHNRVLAISPGIARSLIR